MKLIDFFKIIGVFLLVAAAVYLFFFTNLKNDLSVDTLRSTLDSYGYWSPLFFIIFFAILTTLFIPATLLTIPSGIIYGLWWGFTLNFIGAMLGATVSFFVARFLGKEFISKLLKKTYFNKIIKIDYELEKHGFHHTLVLRLLPFLPFVLVDYALGVSRIKFKDYFLGTAVGVLPTIFLFAYFGASLASLNWISISISIILVALIYFVGRYFKNKRLKKVLEES
ncbi:SNARE associated Golgi protein [uncultured archaeon]|nr:SNARE associated Golgi protein [uncultured archaeon]